MERGKMRKIQATGSALLICALACLACPCAGEETRLVRVPGIFRVNTDISAGERSLAEIVEKAKEAKIGFVVVSDQFLVQCEYGLPPLRNLLKLSKERKSVSTFGIDKYLELVKAASEKEKSLVLIPGVDVAPHYYWSRTADGALLCRQFSQQLTVFGEIDSGYLRSMPVIHNSRAFLSPRGNLRKLSPLILCLSLAFLLLLRRRAYYDDAQGNRYYRPMKARIATASALFATGLLLTLNNKPFIAEAPFDQYHDYGDAPYQALLDHARRSKGGRIGIVWSSPEAKSAFDINGVMLATAKYAGSIVKTNGHNGFAGIYGDARTAHLPGMEWDQALAQFCRGERKIAPFTFGELDYHKDYDGLPFDFIKTVVFLGRNEEKSAAAILDAMLNGRSYAVAKHGENEIVIDDFNVSAGAREAFPGGTVSVYPGEGAAIHVEGCFHGGESIKPGGRISLVFNGREIAQGRFSSRRFSFDHALDAGEIPQGMNYVRFIMESESSGEVLSNPIFLNSMSANTAVDLPGGGL